MPKVKKKKGFFYIFCITILAIIAFFLFWILKDVPFGLDNQPEPKRSGGGRRKKN